MDAPSDAPPIDAPLADAPDASFDAFTCPSSFARCGTDAGLCGVDRDTDRRHCGACGRACGLTERCEVGTCVRERIIDGDSSLYGGCVLLESGRVLCWGDNMYGLLVVSPRSLVPVEVPGLPTDLAAINISPSGAFAITSRGELWSWGFNVDGELGRPELVSNLGPGPAELVDFPIRRIVVGPSAPCAIDLMGSVWCWGTPFWPEMTVRAPYRLELPGAVRDMCSYVGGSAVAVTDAGAFSWGGDWYGIRGAEPFLDMRTPPRVFVQLPPSTRVWCNYQAFALLETGTVWAWGRDASGALADGPPDAPLDFDPWAPARDPMPTYLRPAPAEIVSFGNLHTAPGGCARYDDGDLWCWGGEYTTGTGRQSSEPARLELPFGPVADMFGEVSGCAVSMDRTRVLCWGINGHGELGNGSSEPSPLPTPVVGFE